MLSCYLILGWIPSHKALNYSQNPLYGHRTVALSLWKESPYIFSKFNPLNTDTPLIPTLSMTPSVSVLTEFDCVTGLLGRTLL